jgi:arylsulfatase A-like enzyme
MTRLLETWRLLLRSIAVPSLLFVCPMVLAKYWRAWSHFLRPLDVLTQCLLIATPILLIEAAVVALLALALRSLIRRGTLEETATAKCADILTLTVLGYGASRVLSVWQCFDWLRPSVLAAIAMVPVIWMRLRNENEWPSIDQYNRSSEFVLPLFFGAAVILLPWRLGWRRFDPIPADPPAAQAAYSKPDIILITFDAMSANDMSLLGYQRRTTPNFERLAKTSHLFTHFYSSSDFTTPAVTSLMTGKDLFAHRVYQLTGMVPAAIRDQNLAQVLKAAGYRTAAVVTNNYANPLHLGIDGSFDYLPEPPANRWLRPPTWPLQIRHSLLFDSDAMPTLWVVPFLGAAGKYFPSFNDHPNVAPGAVFALSERLIDAAGGPLFLWIHLFPPHFPYMTRARFRGLFLAGHRFTTQADFQAARHLGHYERKTQPVFDQLRARYDESIANCDAALGSFLNWLDARGRRAHTLLVVSADHGESFHQWWGHESPFLLYPEVHIPLLISTPGQKTEVRHDEDAGLADVAPTILALAGIAPPRWMSGHALLPSSMETRQPAFAAYLARSYTFGPPRLGTIAAFSGDYELVWFFPAGAKELFDVRNDPDGTVNVFNDNPTVAASLTRAIRLRYGGEVPALSAHPTWQVEPRPDSR